MEKAEIREIVGRDDPLILEIGCNDGTDSVELRSVFPRCTLHCFECDPRALRRFREKITDDWCSLHEVAISNCDGTADLHMSSGKPPRGMSLEDWDLSSSLLPPKMHLKLHPWVTFERACEVRTSRLDTWAAAHIPDQIVDFIWMDVQGAEHLVIEGGAATFARTRVCYFEYYNEEMYAGQETLRQILRRLRTFRLLATYEGYNALAVNTSLY